MQNSRVRWCRSRVDRLFRYDRLMATRSVNNIGGRKKARAQQQQSGYLMQFCNASLVRLVCMELPRKLGGRGIENLLGVCDWKVVGILFGVVRVTVT